MADDVQRAPRTDTGNTDDTERTYPSKKRPPKLRRRVESATESTGEKRDVSEPSYRKANRASDRGTAPTGSDSGGEQSHNSDSEPLAPAMEEQVDNQKEEQPSPRPTSELDRPKTASVGNWQRRIRGRRGNQDLVPLGGVDEVGKTVNGAVDAVQDVGSKAVRSAGNTLGQVTGNAVGALGNEEKGKEEQLRLRLDLNLDIEVQLKAKIHGDLTLQLLN